MGAGEGAQSFEEAMAKERDRILTDKEMAMYLARVGGLLQGLGRDKEGDWAIRRSNALLDRWIEAEARRQTTDSDERLEALQND